MTLREGDCRWNLEEGLFGRHLGGLETFIIESRTVGARSSDLEKSSGRCYAANMSSVFDVRALDGFDAILLVKEA